MNIFVLNEDPVQAAKDQCDKHVVKMILETAQMLSTTQRWFYEDDYCNRVGYYKIAHINHPCTIWARTDASNYQWLYEHFVALCDEYTKRYGKVHLTDTKLRDKLSYIPGDMPSSYPNKTTPFAQAMPDEYKDPTDAVKAYRNYYIGEKSGFAKWEYSETPDWFIQQS